MGSVIVKSVQMNITVGVLRKHVVDEEGET